MGKVFTQMEVAARKIPSPKSFAKMADRIRDRLSKVAGITGAVLGGSVLAGESNIRSDIDCLVVYKNTPRARKTAFAAMHALHAEAASLYVPVEFIPLDLDTVRSPLHHVGPSFAAALEHAARNGGTIKADPMPFFVHGHMSVQEDVRHYVRNKLRRFEKGIYRMSSLSETARLELIQKALEAPVHIARKWLHAEGVEMPDHRKLTVTELFCERASRDERSLYHEVLMADSRYTLGLHETLVARDMCAYEPLLRSFEPVVGQAHEFTRLMARRLSER